MQDVDRRRFRSPPPNAIPCAAAIACPRIAHLHLKGRDRRCNKVELSNGTNEFAKTRMFEKSVDDEYCSEVDEDQPRRPPGTRPQGERLVEKKYAAKQNDGKPFVSQRSRPVEARLPELAQSREQVLMDIQSRRSCPRQAGPGRASHANGPTRVWSQGSWEQKPDPLARRKS